MFISTKSTVLVNGKSVRVLSSRFNAAVRTGESIRDSKGSVIVPSKNLSWSDVSKLLRAKKKIQASVL